MPVILVVEDDPDVIDLLREAMIEVSQEVSLIVHATVAGALAWLAAQPIDGLPALVVTDHHLRDRRGHDLIASIRADLPGKNLPVVMVSGDATPPPGIEGIAWFGKPDTWKGWRQLARVLAEQHLASD